MSHLQRVQYPVSRRLFAGLAMAALLCGTPAQAQTAPVLIDINQVMHDAQIKKDAESLGQSGNYDDCLDYKISGSMYWCPGFILMFPVGPLPTPCIDFDYSEPDAIVEVTCSGKTQYGGAGGIAATLAGSNQHQAVENCVKPIKGKDGVFNKQFYDAIVRNVAMPQSRFAMAGSPIQKAQSYTCGILGIAGNMNMLTNLQNFNLAQTLNPSTWGNAIQSSVQGVQTSLQNLNLNSMFSNLGNMFNGDFLTNAFQGLQQQATSFFTGLQSMGTSLQSSLQGLMNGQLPIANINPQEMLTQGANFLGMGDIMGAAGALNGDGNLLNAGIALVAAGNALQMIPQPGVTQAQAATLAANADNSLKLGAQGLNISATTTAAKDTFYAASFTPANFGQAANSELTINATIGKALPKNIESDGYASWSFLPRTLNANGQSSGFLEDGASQVVMGQLVSNISTTLGWINGMSDYMATKGITSAKSFTPSELCSSQKQLESAIKSLAELRTSLGPDSSPTDIIPTGSYLNSSQFQVALKTTPVASCPLTNAGFVAKESDPSKLEIINCTSVCTGGGDEPRICRIVPKAGFAGSCYANALSVQKDQGLYPACNGQLPDRVANGTGGWRNTGGGYDASKDHNGRINAIYRNKILQAEGAATQRLTQAGQALADILKQQGGACTALGNPTGPKEWLASTPMPGPDMTAQAGPDIVNGSFAALRGLEMDTGLMNLTGASDMLHATLTMGVQNLTLAQAGRFNPELAPVVLDTTMGHSVTVPAQEGLFQPGTNTPLNLTMTAWTAGDYTDGSNIMTRTFQALDNANGLVGEMAGCSSKLLLDIADTSRGSGVNSTACWGDTKTFSGYSSHKVFGPNTIASRAFNATVALGGVAPDTSGEPIGISRDGLNDRQEATTSGMVLGSDGVPTTPGGSHRNSKCYPEGSLNPAQYTPGEQIIPAGEMLGAIADSFDFKGAKTDTDNGSVVFTYWKNTKCCIPPACPYNIHQIH